MYSFVYANVGVISVDANELSYEIQTNTGYSQGAQLRWLESTLRQWRSRHHWGQQGDFIVAFFHHCAYSTTDNHASDGGICSALDPLFTPSGPQLLPEGQRYRGYQPPGGRNKKENNTENVVNSYYWSDANTKVNADGYPAGTKVAEEVTWSQVRYDDYAFLAVDVEPAHRGTPTTMTVRTLADGLPGSHTAFTEIDRITFRRFSGTCSLDLADEADQEARGRE